MDVATHASYGIVGPAGMDPKLGKILRDGFKGALDDSGHLKLLEQLNQACWYQSSEAYASRAAETFRQQRSLIERPDFLAK